MRFGVKVNEDLPEIPLTSLLAKIILLFDKQLNTMAY
jgi:hypothetical protein